MPAEYCLALVIENYCPFFLVKMTRSVWSAVTGSPVMTNNLSTIFVSSAKCPPPYRRSDPVYSFRSRMNPSPQIRDKGHPNHTPGLGDILLCQRRYWILRRRNPIYSNPLSKLTDTSSFRHGHMRDQNELITYLISSIVAILLATS